MADPRRNELGDFLRSRRARLSPKTMGLPESGRRRTEGLRREEVAQLAGIGVDWYVRLEQGRAVSPSAMTIDALARALRLSKTEHAHMRALTGAAMRRPFVRETVPETLRRVVEGLNKPAYITGRRWDVLFWNDAADEVFALPPRTTPPNRRTMSRSTRSATWLRLCGYFVRTELSGNDWNRSAMRTVRCATLSRG